jgi:hypothetical protein
MYIIAHAVFLAHPAVERLVLRMRMNVDEPRQQQPILAIDNPVRGTGVISSGESDLVVDKRDIDAAAIDLVAGCFVPRNNPIEVSDHCRSHRAFLPSYAKRIRKAAQIIGSETPALPAA